MLNVYIEIYICGLLIDHFRRNNFIENVFFLCKYSAIKCISFTSFFSCFQVVVTFNQNSFYVRIYYFM